MPARPKTKHDRLTFLVEFEQTYDVPDLAQLYVASFYCSVKPSVIVAFVPSYAVPDSALIYSTRYACPDDNEHSPALLRRK
eukprot:7640835-Pyramimonas_sp.AAC.1